MEGKGNKVLITVLGSEYAVISREEPAYVHELARRLDEKIREIMRADDRNSLVSASVLCALEYQNELLRQTAGTDNLRSQIQDYLEDFNKARIEIEELKRRIESLKRENFGLKEQVLTLKEKLSKTKDDR